MNPTPPPVIGDAATAAAHEAVAGFGAALDRRVAASRAARILAVIAAAMITLIGCVCAATALRAAGVPVPGFLAWLAAAAAAFVGLPTVWPGRLDTARDIERACPPLGERISRAVGLLAGQGPAAGRSSRLTRWNRMTRWRSTSRETRRLPRLENARENLLQGPPGGAGRPWKNSSETFSGPENLRFSRVPRTRHVIPDVRQAVVPQPIADGGRPAGGVASPRPLASRLVERAAQEASAALARAADGPLPSVRSARIGASACGGMLLILGTTCILLPNWRRALIETALGTREGTATAARDGMTSPPVLAQGPPRREAAPDAGPPAAVERGIAVHRMLEGELATRFARGPGLGRQEISAAERDWLDRAAVLQQHVADDLLQALQENASPAAGWRAFAAGQTAGLAAVPAAMRENRLAAAVSLIRAFLEAASAAGLATALERDALRETIAPLVSGTRPPADAAELAAARLARLVDPRLGRRSLPASTHAPAAAAGPGEEGPPERADGAPPAGETSLETDPTNDAGGARGRRPDGAGPLPGPGSAEPWPAAGGGPLAALGTEAWVAGRDRSPAGAVEGLAGTPSVAPAAAVDRYFSILAGEADAGEATR